MVPSNAIVTDKCLVKDLDLLTIRDSDLDFEVRRTHRRLYTRFQRGSLVSVNQLVRGILV